MGLGSEIRDPEKTYSGSRIQGSKKHWIPDPDPQHWLEILKIFDADPDPGSGILTLNPGWKNPDPG
jgi:hypothetical protein